MAITFVQKKIRRQRVDLLLVQRGLAQDQSQAQALVLAGKVFTDRSPLAKPGMAVSVDAELHVSIPEAFVGRGGLKLEHALDVFGIDVFGKVAGDVGASTGGFTDCLLKRGAARVYAIDVGKGQLDWRLRRDPRVIVKEGVNARYPLRLPEVLDLVTIDVSFISVTKVIPTAARAMRQGGCIVVLVKPQFEAEKREVARGGVVRDPVVHARVLARFITWAVTNDFRVLGLVTSPIQGADGNTEFFVLLGTSELDA
jgi:23S rRNA (cytidine1920-2'-O)/16S rRNA (cytidine1409-2'-O)-methyltransferase